jgi:hypothetical protein
LKEVKSETPKKVTQTTAVQVTEKENKGTSPVVFDEP